MLKQRLVTALVLMGIFILAVMMLSKPYLALLFGIITVLGAREWSRLCGWTRQLWWYPGFIALVLWAVYPMLETQISVLWLLSIAIAWWIGVAAWVLFYERRRPIMPSSSWMRAFFGVLAMVPAWAALVELHATHGPYWSLFLFALVWATDSGAYFAGREWGTRKLAPRISPGKTWAGLLGGLFAALFIACSFAWLQHLSWRIGGWLLAIAALTSLVSILGDLLESMLKRHAQAKDSGSLLPGHGGVLDRIDSLTASAPVFVFCLLQLDLAS